MSRPVTVRRRCAAGTSLAGGAPIFCIRFLFRKYIVSSALEGLTNWHTHFDRSPKTVPILGQEGLERRRLVARRRWRVATIGVDIRSDRPMHMRVRPKMNMEPWRTPPWPWWPGSRRPTTSQSQNSVWIIYNSGCDTVPAHSSIFSLVVKYWYS